MIEPEYQKVIKPGAVVQIAPEHGRNGWIGAFVLVEEVKTWGIQGFVHVIETHDVNKSAYIRLKWDEIDLVCMRAPIVPMDINDKTDE